MSDSIEYIWKTTIYYSIIKSIECNQLLSCKCTLSQRKCMNRNWMYAVTIWNEFSFSLCSLYSRCKQKEIYELIEQQNQVCTANPFKSVLSSNVEQTTHSKNLECVEIWIPNW